MKKVYWDYIIGWYFGMFTIMFEIIYGVWAGVIIYFLGIFIMLIKPTTLEQQPGKNIVVSTSGKEAIGMSSNSLKLAPFLAHGAGCEYEKGLNKNNENIMEGGK